MSLSSFLLGGNSAQSSGKGKEKALDEGLDSLFRTVTLAAPPQLLLSKPKATLPKHAKPPESFLPSSSKGASKRKRRDVDLEESIPVSSDTSIKKSEQSGAAAPDLSDAGDGSPKPKRKRSKGVPQPTVLEDDSDNDDAVEANYRSGLKAEATVRDAPHQSESSDEAAEDSEGGENDFDPSKLVHESVAKGASSHSQSKKTKYVPPGETSAQRDARTIFIGNVPVEVMKNRPMQKQLKRHILQSVPSASIESIRFRSVAFQKPTTKLPTSDDETTRPSTKSKSETEKGRAHDRDRAAHWREAQDAKDDAAVRKDEKKFLTAAAKKKIAFIKGELHPTAASANAYLVFAYPHPDGAVEEQKHILDPHEAARLAVEKCDGTVFLERTIRVDRVGNKSVQVDGTSPILPGDPKRTLFVGNLDFASKEEDLRIFFESLVAAERGPPPTPQENDGEEDGEGQLSRRPAWVNRVRIIRDKETQLGKGFAYVQFEDRECVDEVLAMPQEKVKFAKRKLRVQRCKTLPGGAPNSRPLAASGSTPKTRTPIPVPVVVPKGDPSLGAKLVSLSKEDRKAAKATDADRLARRMAKKQAKVAAAKSSRSLTEDKTRLRKRPGGKKGPGAARKETKKRSMSEKTIAKRNVKK